MKSVRALWLVAGLLGAFCFQAFHHHGVHDGGFFKPHDDCAVCSRTGGPFVGDLVPDVVVPLPLLVFKVVVSSAFWADYSKPFLQPFGRAPPVPSASL